MLLTPFHLVVRIVRRFRTEHYAQTAAALSFTTLLGLVPMIAVGAALIESLPFALKLSAALEKFLLSTLLPEKAGAVIAKYLGQFANRAARMTWIGFGALLLTGLLQMLTIEHAFNRVWNVRKHRPWLKRLGLHLLALLVGPLVFGGALFSITFLATASFGLINEPVWVRIAFSHAIPLVFLAGLFSLLYWALPNRPVTAWHAGVSGLLAALAFVGMQRLFTLYVVKLPTYTLVYGAFSTVPIFLAWLYLSWFVILVGALLTAEMSRTR